MNGSKRLGLVDVLWGLDVIAGRASYGGSDFILAGPLNLWFKGMTSRVQPYLILVASDAGAGRLSEVLSIGSEPVAWEEWWNGVEGRRFRGRLRGLEIALLADPILSIGGEKIRFKAKEMSRRSSFIVLGKSIIRLAPLEFEVALWKGLGGMAGWRVEGLGGVASP